jgi:AAA family ATP:ADP antiporter
MSRPLLRRVLSPVVELRESELITALMMFAYSFLAMTSYTALKPVTRSKFISDLGAENLPIVQFAFGIAIVFIMRGYAWGVGKLPRRYALPFTQVGLVGLLVAFWVLFQSRADWVSAAFYFFGLILGILLISQFWTLANDVYDPRQAKRLFGFIGGGASLGGIAGSSLALQAKAIGTTNLLLVSAVLMVGCLVLVTFIIKREKPEIKGSLTGGEDESVSGSEALQLLRSSRHLQIIALIIAFAAIGAAIIEQQLNMATAEAKGAGNTDSITSFLGQVQLYTSMIGFVIQIWLTSKIQRYLGIGFALLILPTSLGLTGTLMLLQGALWVPALARVIDTSLRYTIDKTTREILFLPLPNELKQQAKPFIDVTVDRFAKGVGALIVLVLIHPSFFGLSWQQLSYASLAMTGLWIFAAVRARREYRAVFRKTLENRDVEPEQLRLDTADLSTIETLIEELASPDARRVLYAIDLLESLDKRQLITPLLLYHESPDVRARALLTLESARTDVQGRWAPAVERMLKDNNAAVRAAAVRALAAVRGDQAHGLMRPYLEDRDPRIAVTAAVALSNSAHPEHVAAAEATLRRLSEDTRRSAASTRREVAEALAEIQNPSFRHLLVPLMYDPAREVAEAAIRTAGKLGAGDYLFVPPLLSLMRNRLLKASAREVLIGYGEGIVDTLAYFMRDPEEDIWIRRHVPSTLAYIPSAKSVEVLVSALGANDGFLRYKAVKALGRLRRTNPELAVPTEAVEPLILKETNRYFSYLSLHYNLVHLDPVATDTLLARALTEKLDRTLDRIYRLLALIYPWNDIAAARWTIEHSEPRIRASALEYLDNLLSGDVRKRVIPVIEDLPLEEKVRRGNVILKSRIRDAEDSLAQLIHDEDEVVAATAMHFVQARGLWSLADDLEYALGHRDVHHWHVFEAASWSLAAQRLTAEERRNRWKEPLPAVELADRMRRMPLFDFVSVDELFRVAAAGRQVRHERGRVLYEAGAAADDLQILLDGKVTRTEALVRGGTSQTIEAPAPLAFEEVIEGAPMGATIRAVDHAICLSLTSEQFLALLSENVELAHGLFRMALEKDAAAPWRGVVPGVLASAATGRITGGLQTVDKILLISEMPVFSRAAAGDLAALAAIAREVPLVAGETLFKAGDPPALYVILAGELALEPQAGGQPESAGPGDTVGVYETLGGADTTGWRGHVTKPGGALRVEREALLDLLTDRIELLQGLFSAMLRRAARESATV